MSNGLIRSAIKALLPYRRFRYRPLENGYFRLLILHPGKRTDDLRCDIITEPLNTIINYFALSYVWGSPKPVRWIRCDHVSVSHLPLKDIGPMVLNRFREDLGPAHTVDQDPEAYLKGRIDDRVSGLWHLPYDYQSPDNLRTKYLGIGPNLEEALLSLRHEKLFLTLWVDALCINQGDLEERAQQVEHMYTIFKNAKKVVAWLGKEQEWTANAFLCASELTADDGNPFSSPVPVQGPRYHGQEDIEIEELEAHPPEEQYRYDPWHPKNYLAFINLIHSPWFQRAWVFQEAVAGAARSILVFQQGNCTLNFHTFQLASMVVHNAIKSMQFVVNGRAVKKVPWVRVIIRYFEADEIGQLEKLFSETKAEVFESISSIVNMYENLIIDRYLADIQQPTKPRIINYSPMLNLIGQLRTTQATDPRDKIYSLLSLELETSSPTGQTGFFHPSRKRFTVNYSPSKSSRDVYIEFICYWLSVRSKVRTLDFLQYVDDRKLTTDPAWPSWLPDWNLPPLAAPLLDCWMEYGATSVKMDNTDEVSSGGPGETTNVFLTTPPSSSAEPPLLAATGLPVLTISAVEPADRRGDPKVWSDMFSPFDARGTYPTTSMIYHTAFDILSHAPFASPSILGLDNDRSPFWECAGPRPHPPEVVHEPAIWDAVGVSRKPFLHMCKAYMVRGQCVRRLFATEKGFIGLGPLGTSVGDVICVLRGAKMPLVVRRVGDRWRVVGECYVYGVMHGEVLEGAEGRWENMVFF